MKNRDVYGEKKCVTKWPAVRFTQGLVLLLAKSMLLRRATSAASMPSSALFPRRGAGFDPPRGQPEAPQRASEGLKVGGAEVAAEGPTAPGRPFPLKICAFHAWSRLWMHNAAFAIR